MVMKAHKPKSNFEPCPEGSWPAVCVDVVDKGMQDSQWGPKHKIQIRWVADAEPKRTDKKPYMVSKKVTLSMGKKSNLRPMLEIWRGKKFQTDQEAYDFDVEALIGAPCQLQVCQEQGDDGPYAFVQAVFKAFPGGPRVAMPKDYVRECNRPGYIAPDVPEEEQPAPEPETDWSQVGEDDDIPF